MIVAKLLCASKLGYLQDLLGRVVGVYTYIETEKILVQSSSEKSKLGRASLLFDGVLQ